MKKAILLLGLVLISCSKDTSDPETIVETIIQKPNVRTTITPTQSSNCPLGGYDILVYDDANSNNSKDAGEETFLQNTICFEENRNITTHLSDATAEDCDYGGLVITVYDDSNSNNEIDSGEEVFYESVECYPRDANVQTTIVDATLEECEYGGLIYTVYDDVDGSGSIDEGETIFHTELKCYPRDANVKTYIVDVDLQTCPAGGRAITTYDDVNDNDVPDEGEEVFYEGTECYPQDSDGDNIIDSIDLCPDTPEGDDVDENGCALSQKDTDNDGVTDDIDQCPETPEGNNVDQFGCPEAPIYVAENGVTIKARDWAEVGTTWTIEGVEYTVVDSSLLGQMIENNQASQAVTTKITDMTSRFYNNKTFNEPIGNWDTSNVVSMTQMFYATDSFNQDLSYWDTSNVLTMRNMFQRAVQFNQPIGSWDVSNTQDMFAMFWGASTFNQDISTWDVSSVTNMSEMFYGSKISCELNNWNVSKVTSMERMFQNTTIFNKDISNWDVSNVTSMGYMFTNSAIFNQDLSSWEVANVLNCTEFFRLANSWTLPKPNFTNCNPD